MAGSRCGRETREVEDAVLERDWQRWKVTPVEPVGGVRKMDGLMDNTPWRSSDQWECGVGRGVRWDRECPK